MTNKTTNASSSDATEMGNRQKKLPTGSFSADDLAKNTSQSSANKDVAKWTSHDVQHWVKQQSKKFELKKATAEKFEMNGRENDERNRMRVVRFRSSVSIADET